MDKKQGKIVSVYVTYPQKGMYCLNKGLVCEILDGRDINSIEIKTVNGGIRDYHTLDELKRLVVREDLGRTCHKQKGCDCFNDEMSKCCHFRPTSKDYPLDSSQWQSAVENINKDAQFVIYGQIAVIKP